jgi:fatty acid-binding protein DegV
MDKVISIMKAFIVNKLYGELIIKFEAGNIVLIRKTENIKV